ncbi:hypothetical protein HK098_004120 [Nowakowskiella sp. JEL0407]|nr:hypothetical protein HK098_004120 [Nowakowskiella sp. JEL0407]
MKVYFIAALIAAILPHILAAPACSSPPANGGTTDTPYYICGSFDGKGATYDTKKDYSGNCDGESGSAGAVFIVANGGSVSNVVIGGKQREGIHCLGSCTINNVTFKNVCEDVLTADGPGTVVFKNIVTNGGKDKVIQHNGSAKVTLQNITVNNHSGKVYRSCGEGGCNGYTGSRSVSATNVKVVGGKVSEILGVKPGDTTNFSGLSGATACMVLQSSGSKIKACVQGKN